MRGSQFSGSDSRRRHVPGMRWSPVCTLVDIVHLVIELIVDLHPVGCRARKLTDQTPLGGNFSKKQVATKESREL